MFKKKNLVASKGDLRKALTKVTKEYATKYVVVLCSAVTQVEFIWHWPFTFVHPQWCFIFSSSFCVIRRH